jgi:hypothetical protein
MATTVTIRDEVLGGDASPAWELHVPAERLTVRELLRSRVYQEVQDYNQQCGQVFHGLVQPEEAEKTPNGWKMKKPRLLDWKQQFDRAIEAFESHRILILVNDQQAEALDEKFVIDSQMSVTFLRLTPLVGG